MQSLHPRQDGEKEGDSFDPDEVDIRPFIDQTHVILWQNVTRTSDIILPDSSYKPLLVFSFLCKAFLRLNHHLSDQEKKDQLSLLYRELVDRCEIRSDQSDERFQRSLNVKWILMNQMKQLGLYVDLVRDATNSVLLSLAEHDVDNNMQLISLIERGKHDSNDLVHPLNQLLLRDPFIAVIIIKQLNELIQLSDRNGLMSSVKSFNFIVRDALIHAIEYNDDVDLVIKLLHIIPEEEISDARLSQSLKELAARLDFLLNDEKVTDNKWSAFFAAVAGRQSLAVAKLLFDLRWENVKRKDESNEEDMLISGEDFNYKNCILLALREDQHFIQQLLDRDISRVDRLPRSFRLHHLLVKMYDASQRHMFLQYSAKLESLIGTSHILLSRDQFSSEIVLRIQWIYDFTHWVMDHLMDKSCKEPAEVVKEKILVQLFNCDPPLQVLSKVGLLSSISTSNPERFDAISAEMIAKLNAYESPSEVMSWYAFMCMRLGYTWLTMNPKDNRNRAESSSSSTENVSITTIGETCTSIGETDEDLEEASIDVEFTSRIRTFLKSIKSLTLRAEVLENLFSLMFVTNRNLQTQKTTTPEPCESPNEVKFMIRNEVVPKFLAFMKDATFEAQTHVRSRLRKVQTASPTQAEPELDPSISSCKDLNDAKMRLEVLLQSIHEGQWRYSVIEQSFHQEMAENSSSIMKSMLASPQQLLRHSLTHGHVDQAKQVYKLFEQQLKGSEESIQLRVSEKILLLGEKIRLLLNTGKRYHHQTSSHRATFETTAKSLKISQIAALFSEFLADTTAITGSAETANILLIDYGLTRSTSMEVSQIAIETGIANLDPKSSENKKMIEFLNQIVALIVVAKNTSASFDSDITLPELVSFNTNQSLFSNPSSLIEESLKKKKLSECIEDIRQMIRGPQEEADETDSGHALDHSTDGKKLVIMFQKLLRLCPPGRQNYLKGLFYHVRRVSRVLNECRNRSRSHSTASPRHRLSSVSSNSSYFSVLYQSPSAILCQMVLKEGVPPTLVHDLSLEMKVDLIGTLCSILCPPIKVVTDPADDCGDFNLISTSYPALSELIETFLTGSIRKMLSRQDTDSSILIENHFKQDLADETYDQEHNRSIISKPDLILYFKKKSPVLVEVLRLLKLIDERKISVFDDDLMINKKTPLGKYILMIRKLFANGADNNDTGIVTIALTPHLRLSNTIIMKSLEDHAEKSDLMSIYNILHFTRTFSDNVFNSSLESLHTAVLSKLAVQEEQMMYILQIENNKTKVDLLVENINMAKEQESVYTDASFCLQCIDAVMGSVKAHIDSQSPHLASRLRKKQKEILCYGKIAQLAGLKTWIDASENLTEADILTILKTKKQYSLALEWDELVKGAGQMEASTDPQIEELRCELLLLSFAEKEMDDAMARIIPNVLAANPNLILKSMSQIENWRMKEVLIRISIEFQQDLDKKSIYGRYLLGIQLIELLPVNARQHYSALISKPNLIIEQMLMNIEYEALEQAVKVRQLINCDDLIEIYSRKALDIKLIQEDSSSYNGSDYTCISSSFVPDSGSASAFFAMPMSVPTKDQWIPDHKVQYCMVCKIEKFSVIFNRKHHCRRCGRVVCHSCSDRYIVIPDHTITSPVRVCLTCYSHMRVVSSDSLNHILRKESFSSVASSLSICQWILSLDEEQNSHTRNEFYYEAAPSSSLCLSILKLHTSISSCIHMILDQMIKSLFDVLTSNQVDYGLILNIIKTLLVSVKVIIETQLPGSIEMRPRREYVDLMLSRVDIVNMLVQQNCINKDLINSIILNESSNNQQSLLKLMERLLEMERFELALNIGKKFGFDVKGIWKTWAVICLKNGKLIEARAKFSYVMDKVANGSGTLQPGSSSNSKNLQSIFEIFADDRTNIRLNQRTALKDRVDHIRKGKINSLVAKETTRATTDILLPKYLQDEALFYLKLYGNKEDYIKFYSRFGLWKNALDVFFSEPNPANLSSCFVADFLLPAMTRSCFSKVLSLIKSQDPTLIRCWKYLIAACKHFGKNNCFNVLHTLQVFMADYLRAGATQVTHFYLDKPYNNYEELRKRLDHLTTARSHLQAFLENQSSHQSKSSYILSQTPAQVKKNIRMINHQIEITRTFADRGIDGFLPINFDSVHSELSPLSESPGSLTASLTASNIFSPTFKSSSSNPLTLFDESKARKTQLCALICVEFGNKISDGFSLCHQLVQEYRLDSGFVYRLAGRIILVTKKAYVIDRLNQLLNCIRSTDEPETLCDDVTGACIRACIHPDLLEPMIKLLVSDINKIDSYILSNKLRSAYLLAVRLERKTDVSRILAMAERTGQEIVKNWCDQWLKRNASA